MTKKNELGENKKRRNQTKHQRAMTTPKVQEIFVALQSNFNRISQQRRREQVDMLIELGCSHAGIADQLHIPPTTLRRHIAVDTSAQAKRVLSSEDGNHFEKKPRQTAKQSAIQAARESKAESQKNRMQAAGVRGAIPKEETRIVLKPQPIERVPAPVSTASAESPTFGDGLSRKEGQVEKETSTMSQVERYVLEQRKRSEKIQQLDSIPARPQWSARSMKRQGRPSEPKDGA